MREHSPCASFGNLTRFIIELQVVIAGSSEWRAGVFYDGGRVLGGGWIDYDDGVGAVHPIIVIPVISVFKD